MKIENMKRENGYFENDGKEYVLVQQAYIDGPVDDPHYTALAICPSDGPSSDGLYDVYDVTWCPRQEWLDGDREDEGDACDWDNPSDVNRIGSGYNMEDGRII